MEKLTGTCAGAMVTGSHLGFWGPGVTPEEPVQVAAERLVLVSLLRTLNATLAPLPPTLSPVLDKCDNQVQLLTFACLAKIILAMNSRNYYAKLPLPHGIFNGLDCKYESWNTVLSQWILLFHTVAWCTASTVTVTWCKLQAAVSDGDKRAREEEESCWGY